MNMLNSIADNINESSCHLNVEVLALNKIKVYVGIKFMQVCRKMNLNCQKNPNILDIIICQIKH